MNAPQQPPKLSSQHLAYATMQEMVMLRNLFYRDSFRSLMVVCLVLIGIVVMLMYALKYETKTVPEPVYFATTDAGLPIQIIGLKYPNKNDLALLEWASEAAVNVYTFNFVNYRNALQDARSYFTRTGYLNFMTALKASNNLIAVQSRKLLVSAQIEANGTSMILRSTKTDDSFRINGRYAWQVQIPMLLTYESGGTDKFLQHIMLTMVITRMSPLESSSGLGIDSFVVREVI
jgi:intracellular multiplication protein IcmL